MRETKGERERRRKCGGRWFRADEMKARAPRRPSDGLRRWMPKMQCVGVTICLHPYTYASLCVRRRSTEYIEKSGDEEG